MKLVNAPPWARSELRFEATAQLNDREVLTMGITSGPPKHQ